jgi:2-iminobutanoate/2-iminopropanoate deaminase
MLATVESDMDHVVHINVFLANIQDFAAMDAAYAAKMGDRRPARTAVAVSGLPKPGALLTMNLTAVTVD